MRRSYVLGSVVAAAAAALLVVLLASGNGGSNLPVFPTSSVYGHPPAWVRIPEPIAVRVMTATPAHPEYQAAEGYTVEAAIPTGSARVMAAGPAEPAWVAAQAQSGQWKAGELAPTTFEVTFSDVVGSVPVRAGAFTVITNQGVVLHPAVRRIGGGAIPSSLRQGQRLALRLSVGLPEGDGSLRWAPLGPRILVGWLWTLELD